MRLRYFRHHVSPFALSLPNGKCQSIPVCLLVVSPHLTLIQRDKRCSALTHDPSMSLQLAR